MRKTVSFDFLLLPTLPMSMLHLLTIFLEDDEDEDQGDADDDYLYDFNHRKYYNLRLERCVAGSLMTVC